MNCQEVENWLLGSRDTPSLPLEARRHLEGCAACRIQHRRLIRLYRAVRDLTPPMPRADAPARLLAELKQRGYFADESIKPVAPRRLSRRPTSVRRWPSLMAAACLLLALTAVLQLVVWRGKIQGDAPPADRLAERDPSPEPDPLPPPQPLKLVGNPPEAGSLSRSVVSKAFSRDLDLAKARTPSARLDTLADLADDLFHEVKRLAEVKAPHAMAFVAGLYDQVLWQGLTRTVSDLDESERRLAAPRVVRRLLYTEWECKRLALRAETGGNVPVGVPRPEQPTAEFRRLAASSRECASAIAAGGGPDRIPLRWRDPPTLCQANQLHEILALFVAQGILLGGAPDSLGRAGFCSEAADRLAAALVRTAADGDQDLADLFSDQLERLLDQGVTDNLRFFDANKATGDQLRLLERIRRHSEQTSHLLEQKLKRVPKPAQNGLERALDAARRGSDVAQRAGKDKLPKGLPIGPPPGKGPWKRKPPSSN